MFQRLVFTITIAIGLTGLYEVYSVAMRPVIIIPEIPKHAIEDFDNSEPELPMENVRVAEAHVPFAKWATESKHTLRMDQAFVYTNDWYLDEANKKSVRFEPFAMVWLTPDQTTGQEEAVSIVSESAQLDFDSAFDEKNRSVGRIVRARLIGKVEIAGPQNLAVRGHEFVFDESSSSLTTWNPVHFWFQAHEGSAARMQMKLIPADGPKGKDRPHVRGVESIRLIAVPNPSDPKYQYVKLKVALPQGDSSIPINVKCSRELEYSFATNTAVLSDEVVAWTGAGKAENWLNCDVLTMQFAPKPNKNAGGTQEPNPQSPPGNPARTEFQKVETDLEFSWFEAESQQPDLRPVKLVSKTRGIKATMASLTYSSDTRTVTMRSDHGKRDVRAYFNRSELRSPRIEAELGNESLTSLLCQGAGEFLFADEQTNQWKFKATWQRKLSMKPDPATKLDLIELDQKVVFRQPEQDRGLAAESIKIWLASSAFKFDSSLSGQNTGKSATSVDPEPKRILAQGDVAMISPEMMIERSNELDIQFEDSNQAQQTNIQNRRNSEQSKLSISSAIRSRSPASAVKATKLKNQSVSNSPLSGFASIPAESDRTLGPSIDIPFNSNTRQPTRPVPSTSREAFVVAADRIAARMLRTPGSQEPKPQTVEATGKVVITQKRKQGEKPLSLKGSRVLIQTQADDEFAMHVVGMPALIRDQRFHIEGKDIHLDQHANQAKVKGPGELTIQIPDQYEIRGTEGSTNRELRIRWNESMAFDGSDARFIGRVEAKLGLGKMSCEQMLVQLASKMSFQTNAIETNPSLKIIECRENVGFEYSSYFEKKQIDVYRGEVGEFKLNYAKEEVVALGPGEIRAWQRKQTDGASFAARDTIQANRPIPTEVAEWYYTQVQFKGRLDGHFEGQITGTSTHQSATIDDRVEVVHGPVKSPSDKVDPDNLPSKGGTMRCHQLQIDNYPKSERTKKQYLELFGVGNAEVEGQVDGRQFTASADQISFDGSTSLYTLIAKGRQTARITGINFGHQSGQRIMFNPDPKLRMLEVDGATNGQISQ